MLRLHAAKEMLAVTSEKVINVAYQAGFSSLAAFNRFFKQQTGQTPTEYRKVLTLSSKPLKLISNQHIKERGTPYESF